MSLGRSAGGPPGGVPGSDGRDAGWRSGGIALWKPGRVIRALARGAVDDLVTTVFPANCRVCKQPLVRAGAVPICADCLTRLLPQKGSLCLVCGEMLGMESERFAEGFGAEAKVCTPCRKIPPPFTRAVAYGRYEGEMREMLHLLKYERVRGLARPLGSMLAKSIEAFGDEALLGESGEELLVVAVPLFRAKQRGRGFNHAEVLADAAVRELRRRRPELKVRTAHGTLERVRETQTQFGLTPQARRRNVRGAFAVKHPARIAGRDVLVIDDIYTTGATARACAGVLRQAGASNVLVATLARAQVESVAMWDGGAHASAGSSQGFGFGAEA